MQDNLKKQAGSALIWRSVQLGGVKIIYLIRLFILARILAPDDFGLLAIAMTGLGFMVNITDLGTVPALIQRKYLEEQHYHSSWTIGVIRAAVIGSVVFFGAPFIAQLFAEARVLNIVRALAFLPLIESLASIKIAELVRELNFRLISLAKLSDAFTNTIIAILFAEKYGVWALVLGALAGPLSFMIISYFIAPYRPRFVLIAEATKTLLNFGKWIFLTGVLAISGSLILRVIITRKLGTEALGLYFMATKIAFLPSEVSSELVGSVIFPVYAKLQSDIDKVVQGFRNVFIAMISLLIPVYILMIFLSSSLVSHLIGDKWLDIIPLIQMLAVVGIFGTVGEATVPLFKGLGHPQRYALLEGAQSTLLIGFTLIFSTYYGIAGVCYAWFPAITGALILSLQYLRSNLGLRYMTLVKQVAIVLGASIVGSILAYVIDRSIHSIVGLTISSGIYFIFMIILLVQADKRFSLGLVNSLSTLFPHLSGFLKKGQIKNMTNI